MTKPVKNHFVSNAHLTKILGEWAADYREKRSKGEPTPPMPNEIGIILLKMVEKYGRKPNFSGYSYLEDMKSEALITCVKYAHNFDSNKSNNAFAWVTQTIHNSFISIINDEKKEAKKKFDLQKEINPKLGKGDFNDIKLDDSNSIPIPELFMKLRESIDE